MKLLAAMIFALVIAVAAVSLTAGQLCESASFTALVSGRNEMVEARVCRDNRYRWVLSN